MKIRLIIDGMHCTSCAFNIDGELEDMEGVNKASTNYAKSETIVEFDEDRVLEKQLVDAISKLGYTATAVKE